MSTPNNSLVIACIQLRPYFYFVNDRPTGTLKIAKNFDVLVNFVKKNFTFKVVDGFDLGRSNATGHYNGMLGLIQRKEADVACHPCTFRLPSQPGIYSGTILEEGISMLMLERRQSGDRSLDIMWPLFRFDLIVWTLLAMSIILCVIILRSVYGPRVHWSMMAFELLRLAANQGPSVASLAQNKKFISQNNVWIQDSETKLWTKINSTKQSDLNATSEKKEFQEMVENPNSMTTIITPDIADQQLDQNWLKAFVIWPLFWLCLLWYTQQFTIVVENQASAQLVIGSRPPLIRNVPELAARHDIQPYFMWQNNLADAFKYGPPAYRQVWSRVKPEHLIKYKQEALMGYVSKAKSTNNIFVSYHIHVRICKQMFCHQSHYTMDKEALYVSNFVFSTLMGLLMRHNLQKWKRQMIQKRTTSALEHGLTDYFMERIPSEFMPSMGNSESTFRRCMTLNGLNRVNTEYQPIIVRNIKITLLILFLLYLMLTLLWFCKIMSYNIAKT